MPLYFVHIDQSNPYYLVDRHLSNLIGSFTLLFHKLWSMLLMTFMTASDLTTLQGWCQPLLCQLWWIGMEEEGGANNFKGG